jgi:threonine-phosphate decarboxylase
MPGHGDSCARDFRGLDDGPRLTPTLDRAHGGDVERWARRAGIEARAMLDFSASINPLGPPPAARKAFIACYGDISRYPDPSGKKLRKALAEHHGMNAAEVLLGNGSTQLIYLLCAALRPRKALIVGPAFSEYANALRLGGAHIRQSTLRADDDFKFSLPRFMSAWDKDCDMVFLPTPNSVTGGLISLVDIERIAHAALVRKCTLVIDEAFVDFVEAESVKARVRRNSYVIVLRSLTKYYALAGLRLGYLLAHRKRVEQLAAYQEPWSVNAPALSVALACLRDASFATKTDRWLKEERTFLSRRLAALPGFHPFPSRANFMLIRIDKNGVDALQLRSFLLGKKILIRCCDSFDGLGAGYFRIAVKRRRDNLRLLAALEEWTVASRA